MMNNEQSYDVAKQYLGNGGSVFRSYCGLGKSDPYCNAFVSYIFYKTGNKSLYCEGRKEVYCPHSIKWCYDNLANIPPYLALPMDVVYFDWELNGTPNHIGFARERKSADVLLTLEGNTSGGKVDSKSRNTKYIQAVFRPHFKASYKIAKLDVDGYFGYNSIAMLQKVLGVEVDGILGKITVKALQKAAGTEQDGSWGSKTSKAVQKLVGAEVDGLFGEKSVKALQRWINANVAIPTAETPKKPVTQPQTPVAPSVNTYTGQLPSLHVSKTAQQVIDDAVRWGKWIAGDNSFHYGYGKHAHHNGCYFCGTQPKSKASSGIKDPEKTYCCNPFVHACFAHGGLVPAMLSLCQKGKSYGFSKNEGYAKSSLFKAMGKLAKSKLVKGDVLCSDKHVALYIGNGKVVQASGGDDNKRNSARWNSSISVGTWNGYTRVYRFIGSVDANMVIRFGEYSDRVKLLQQFLNWYNGKAVLTVDGIFGENTLKYVKVFQTAQKIAVDGIVGSGTLAKMKTATR